MPVSPRNLIALSAAGLAIIAVALAVNGSKALPPLVSRPAAAPASGSGLKTEPSFYEEGATQKQPPGAAAPAAPAVPKLPAVSARSYVVGNVRTGQVYMQRNATKVLPVASMSKLVTAIDAIDSIPLSSVIEITDAEAMAPPDTSGIRAGERFTAEQLLYPMLLNSSNIAAEAFASSSDRAHFMEEMTAYAWEVGMPSSYFADPSGVDPHNAANANDLFALARYLYKYRSDILNITKTAHLLVATTTDHGSHDFASIHPFVNDPRFLGGKTGHTPEAGDTMMTLLNINGEPVAFVILGAQSGARESDTKLLISQLAGIMAGR